MIMRRAKPVRMIAMHAGCDGRWGHRHCVSGRVKDVPTKVMPSWTSCTPRSGVCRTNACVPRSLSAALPLPR